MNNVIQEVAIFYMENHFFKGYTPLENKLLILIRIPVEDSHAQHAIIYVCILSSDGCSHVACT